MDEYDPMDPFASAEIWRTNKIFDAAAAEEVTSLFLPLELNGMTRISKTLPETMLTESVPEIRLKNPYAPTKRLDEDLALLSLEPFDGQLEDPSISEGSVFSAEPDAAILDTVKEEDIWTAILDEEPSDEGKRLYSWEGFVNSEHKEPCSAYLSEAGQGTFDAVLKQADERRHAQNAGVPLESKVLLRSLISLGLGRSSIFFVFNEDEKRFQHAVEDCRMPGHSRESSQHFIRALQRCGDNVRTLRDFSALVYQSGRPVPAVVALAHSVATILAAFESHIHERTVDTRSFLQLQSAFERPAQIVGHVAKATAAVQNARSNEAAASQLFVHVLNAEYESNAARALFRELLKRVAQPWFVNVNEWIGLNGAVRTAEPFPARPSFAIEAGAPAYPSQTDADLIYDSSQLPGFVGDETGMELFETGATMELLRRHHPSHPLCALDKNEPVRPQLHLAFGWGEIERISAAAADYERSLSSAIIRFQDSTLSSGQSGLIEAATTLTRSPDAISNLDAYSWEQLSSEIGERALTADLADVSNGVSSDPPVRDMFSNDASDSTDAFDPEFHLAPSLSISPLLSTQRKLVNASILRLLFRTHRLRAHLDLQHQFHLLGNGSFITSLTSALFDPERATAERKKGVMRSNESMGLRLGHRTAWPPASSELQLALMGIMNDCYQASGLPAAFGAAPDKTNPSERAGIPGTLNFAIRQLSPAEAEKCMDPSSLFALDFLRLQYSPPSPVNAVVTPSSLEKYDAVFKAMLRLQRMLFVASRLARDAPSSAARRTRVAMHAFVTVCCGYFFVTGVAESWAAFTAHLSRLEEDLAREDASGAVGTLVKAGVADVRAAHEGCLDRIMFALLLRKRQVQVMQLLEDIFGLVLEFAKMCGAANDALTPDEDEVRRLNDAFKNKVGIFLSVCRGLVGKKGYGLKANADAVGGEEENTIERLVLGLEMNGYYSR